MILRKICAFVALFFLVPFVNAYVDFPALANEITKFAEQIDKSNKKLADKLKMKASILLLTNQIQLKKALNEIVAILYDVVGSTKDESIKEKLASLKVVVEDAICQLVAPPPIDILQRKACDYFSGLNQCSRDEIKFLPKQDGVQLGCKVIVNGVKYHVKTHRYGLSSSANSSEAKTVDLIEPFCYKFLEYSRFGPEVHFFWASEKDFYIATKDISSIGPEELKVIPYEMIKREFLFNENYSKGKSRDVVIKGLFIFDIIGEIFQLSDILTNTGNFYFLVDSSNNIVDFKIIDFDTNYAETSTIDVSFSTTPPSTPRKDVKGYSPFKSSILSKISEDDKKSIFASIMPNIMVAIDCAFNDICILKEKMPNIDLGSIVRYVSDVKNIVNQYANDLCIEIDHIAINEGIFFVYDVPPDGNCGIWAIMRQLSVDNFNDDQIMQQLRNEVAKIAAKDPKAAARIGNPGKWIDTEDFKYFARHLGRPIAIVVQEDNNQTYRHYAADGDITDTTSITQLEFLNLINQAANTIVIYQIPGHYQALIRQ